MIDGSISGSGEFAALLIDGQQRMTALLLLALALANYVRTHEGKAPNSASLDFRWRKLRANCLLRDDEVGSSDLRRYKLRFPKRTTPRCIFRQKA